MLKCLVRTLLSHIIALIIFTDAHGAIDQYGCNSNDELKMINTVNEATQPWSDNLASYTYQILSDRLESSKQGGAPYTRWIKWKELRTELVSPNAVTSQLRETWTCAYDDGQQPSRRFDYIRPRFQTMSNDSFSDLDTQSAIAQIPLVGADFSLHYASDREPDRILAFQYDLLLKPHWISPSTTKIYIDVTYDGGTDTIAVQYPTTLNARYKFSWDGKRRSGAVADFPTLFRFELREFPDNGQPPGRGRSDAYLGTYNAKAIGLGGWTLGIHHYYNKHLSRLYKGNGETLYAKYFEMNNGDLLVVDPNSQELLYFSSEGKHKETRTNLLNQLIYSFSYDTSARLQEIGNAYGRTLTVNRNSSGQLTGITTFFGQATSLELNSKGKLRGITNPKGENHIISYHQGGSGLLASLEKPMGQVTYFKYDLDGRLVKNFMGNNFSVDTLYSGDATNGPTLITLISKASRQTTHEIENRIDNGGINYSRVTNNPSGLIVEHQESHNMVKSKYGDFVSETKLTDHPRFQYLSQYGSEIKTYNQNYPTQHFTKNFTLMTNPRIRGEPFNWTTFTKTLIGPSSNATAIFTKSTASWSLTSHMGRTSSVKLDPNHEQLIELDSPYAAPISFAYNNDGNLASIQHGTRELNFTYNSSGLLSSISNALSQTTLFAYDLSGNMTKITLPDSREFQYTYDKNGKLSSIKPPGSDKYIFSYGYASELLSSLLPPELNGDTDSASHFFYDDDGLIKKINRANGSELNYSYVGTTSQLSSISDGTNSYIFGTYSNQGVPNAITSPDGIKSTWNRHLPYTHKNKTESLSPSQVYGTTEMVFNQGLLQLVKILDSSSTTVGLASYSFDNDRIMTAVGNLTYIRNSTTGLVGASNLLSINDTYAYNSFGELDSYSSGYSSTVKYSYAVTRDLVGRISSVTENVLGTLITYDYTYDDSGRLQEIKIGGTTASSYIYDSNSNMISGLIGGSSFTGAYNSHDQLTDWNEYHFVYNKSGELTSKTDTLTGSITSYAWDAWGKLKSVTLPSSDVVSYKYDGADRKSIILQNGIIQSAYLYDNSSKLVAEMNSSGQLISQFVWGKRTDSPEYMIKSGNIYRFVTDPRGSVRLVINGSTGVIAQRIDYDDFGRVTYDSNPGFQPFGFCGGFYDHRTSIVNIGLEIYDGHIGRPIKKIPTYFAEGRSTLHQHPIIYQFRRYSNEISRLPYLNPDFLSTPEYILFEKNNLSQWPDFPKYSSILKKQFELKLPTIPIFYEEPDRQ